MEDLPSGLGDRGRYPTKEMERKMNTPSRSIERLRLVLRLNSASCLFCGAAMALWHNGIAEMLGNANSVAVLVVGICLFFNGMHLVSASMRQSLRCYEIAYFALGDFGWVIATALMIGLGVGITSTAGITLAIAIALMVGIFGLLQAKFGTLADAEGLLSNQIP